MNRRQAVLTLGGVALAAEARAADPPDGVHIPTDDGWRMLAGEEAKAYHTTNRWLQARLKEVEAVRVGSTYAQVARLFRRDGGLSATMRHRFVHGLCPFVKINVEFEDVAGRAVGHPIPATARVVRVSRPYFEPEFGD